MIKNFKNNLPFYFAACWALLLLANFVPTFPQPNAIIGYLWKVEFALAAFLLTAIVLIYKYAGKSALQFSRNEFIWIFLPLLLFTTWSGISVFWAESIRSAIHHTLLWGCYIVFYLLMRQIVNKLRHLRTSMAVSGVVIFILGILCLTEYLTTSAENSVNVSLRYAKYAEVIAALFVFFVAFAIQKKNNYSFFCGVIAVVSWMAIVSSLGRTQFVAGFVGISVFAVFALVVNLKEISLKKSLILASFFILATVFSQISFSDASKQTTLKRFSTDEQSQTSFQVRILIWQIAFDNFKQNPLQGAGAENFAANYKNSRTNFAQNNAENKNIALYEDILPERAHNEFLQILAELGIVGFIFFGWILCGILYFVFRQRKGKTSLLSIAAFAAIAAFLVSSMASSYSFRVPANGLCFFFALAILVQSSKFKVQSSSKNQTWNLELRIWNLKPFVIASIFVCAAMLTFSAVRGVSLMYLQNALTAEGDEQKDAGFQKVLTWDESDAMIRYYYGIQLYNSNRAAEAAPHIRFGIERGIATSVAYFNLASAQIVQKQTDEADKTFTESLQIYPRSVFLRTAYASFLEDFGNVSEAEKQYEKAKQINPEQTRSWRLAFTEGMKNLSEKEGQSKDFVKVMDLSPGEGIYALLDFQRQFRPNLVRR